MKIQLKLWHLLTVQVLLLASLVWAADSRITDLTELTDGNVATGDFLPIVDVSDTTDNAAGSSRKVTVQSLESRIHGAGSATAGSWPVFGSGTVLTTAEDGALEQDAYNFYLTTDAGNRGIVPVVHYLRAASAQTLTSQTAAQNIFDSPANGRITLETGAYEFEGLVLVTGMSATSGNAQILFACGGTCGGYLWWTSALDNSSSTSITADLNGVHTTNATAASIVTAGTGTALRVHMKGSFEVTAAGTWTPQIALVTAAAATIAEGSYFKVYRMGETGTASIGQWD